MSGKDKVVDAFLGSLIDYRSRQQGEESDIFDLEPFEGTPAGRVLDPECEPKDFEEGKGEDEEDEDEGSDSDQEESPAEEENKVDKATSIHSQNLFPFLTGKSNNQKTKKPSGIGKPVLKLPEIVPPKVTIKESVSASPASSATSGKFMSELTKCLLGTDLHSSVEETVAFCSHHGAWPTVISKFKSLQDKIPSDSFIGVIMELSIGKISEEYACGYLHGISESFTSATMRNQEKVVNQVMDLTARTIDLFHTSKDNQASFESAINMLANHMLQIETDIAELKDLKIETSKTVSTLSESQSTPKQSRGDEILFDAPGFDYEWTYGEVQVSQGQIYIANSASNYSLWKDFAIALKPLNIHVLEKIKKRKMVDWLDMFEGKQPIDPFDWQKEIMAHK